MSTTANTHPTVRHRALWVSDVHLGSSSCQADRLAEFLRHNDCERLYLVGDIIDGWKLKSRFYWNPQHTRVIQEIINKARHGTRVYYLAGNHDDFLREFLQHKQNLGPIRIAREIVHTTADGRRLLVLHGDRYDQVLRDNPQLGPYGDVAYEGLMRVNHWLNVARDRMGMPYWSLSNSVKYLVKELVQYLSGFDNAVYVECRRRSLNGVICGHTHHAEIRYLRNDVISYNCGDWVESCTALREDAKGRLSIVSPNHPKQAEAVTEAAPVPTPSIPTSSALLQNAAPIVFENAYEVLRKVA